MVIMILQLSGTCILKTGKIGWMVNIPVSYTHLDVYKRQVLEHVPAPLETLEQLKAYISPETILRVRVPNILRPPEGADIWKAWPYDGKRVHIMAPFEHLHGFVPLSLIALLNRSGFKPLPLNALWRQYPVLATRNLINRFYPPAGQTMLLAKL